MYTVSTYKSHVSRAWSFYNDTPNIMFGIGKNVPWPDENNPPDPSIDKDGLDELIGLKRINMKKFVIPDPTNGTIIIDGVRWKIIEADPTISGDTLYNAVRRNNARWVYVQVMLEESDFINVSYREIGLYSRMVLKSGVNTSNLVYKPTDFSDLGILEVWKTREPIYRTSGQREELTLIMEF